MLSQSCASNDSPPVVAESGIVRQDEVAAGLGGIPWRHCRRLLQAQGIEVLPDGARRWVVRRADWAGLLERLSGQGVTR
jgi:hypothetical protein